MPPAQNQEDAEDLEEFEKRANQPTISWNEMLRKLGLTIETN